MFRRLPQLVRCGHSHSNRLRHRRGTRRSEEKHTDPDAHGETSDLILYTGRRRDQKLDAQNRALLDAISLETSVPLFNKLAPGRWEFLGNWCVTDGRYIFDEMQERMLWKFTLERTTN